MPNRVLRWCIGCNLKLSPRYRVTHLRTGHGQEAMSMNMVLLDRSGFRARSLFMIFAAFALQTSAGAGGRFGGDDEQAKALLAQMAATMRLAKTLEAQMEI